MIELHTHSLLSDGVLLPTEALQRAVLQGFETFAITDHVDTGSLERVTMELARLCQDLKNAMNIRFLPGVEITHVPPVLIPGMISRARRLGARLVLVHGETISESVAPGTNRAALEGGCDILAHPGLIGRDEVRMASEKGICLELSGRRGHCLANGHVAQLAREMGAALVINSDAHEPGDVMHQELRLQVGLGAGLEPRELDQALENMRRIAERCLQTPVVL